MMSGDGVSGDDKRVVVGVNGSPASLAALRAAAAEARSGGRRLVAVYVWEPPEGEVLYLRNPERIWASYWKEQARGRLDRAFNDAFGGTPPGLDVERKVVRDRPDRALLALADGPDDLLVIGAGGHRGRVRRRIQNRAESAVLTVPAPSLPKGMRRRLRRVSPADFAEVS
ncbi:universal stress protein [Streptomyces halobius]|uniref:Universal stress protein n=1 Tax=Streptomyces halobius TaxID=2879846 RepID=A0ABY4MHK2_9ACTN|nr:universal stress protein [Streptomyces halobius]UQA95806.1 universal stress protein [Streptomyces halobius]